MEALFKSVRFFTTGKISSKVEDALEGGGGKREAYFTDYTTHLIVGQSPDEDVVNEAHDLYERPALRASWVTMSMSAGKLLPLSAFNYSPSQLFHGMRFCCTHLARDDVTTIWAAITYHGGRFQKQLTPGCSHLIAGKADGAKYARATSSDLTVVTPDWVVNSARDAQCLDVAAYHPRLLVVPPPPAAPDHALAAITGFGGHQRDEDEQRRASAEHDKQQLLAKLKQNLPWNRPSDPQSSEVAGSVASAPPTPAVAAPQLTASSVAPGASQQSVTSGAPQQSVAPGALHQSVASGALHQSVDSGALHQSVASGVLHQSVASGAQQHSLAPPVSTVMSSAPNLRMPLQQPAAVRSPLVAVQRPAATAQSPVHQQQQLLALTPQQRQQLMAQQQQRMRGPTPGVAAPIQHQHLVPAQQQQMVSGGVRMMSPQQQQQQHVLRHAAPQQQQQQQMLGVQTWRPPMQQQQPGQPTPQRHVWVDEHIVQIQERLASLDPQQRQQYLERMDPQQRSMFISHIHRQRMLQQQQQQQWQLRQTAPQQQQPQQFTQGVIRAGVKPMQVRTPVRPQQQFQPAALQQQQQPGVAQQQQQPGLAQQQQPGVTQQQQQPQQRLQQQPTGRVVQMRAQTPGQQVRPTQPAAGAASSAGGGSDASEPIQQQVQQNLEKIRQTMAAQQQQQLRQQQLQQQQQGQPISMQQQLAQRQLAAAAHNNTAAAGTQQVIRQPVVQQQYVLRHAEPGQHHQLIGVGQRIVQVGTQQIVLPQGHTLTPEMRQQILNNQQNLVQPKTKTALANLLNNRLSSGPVSGGSTPDTPGTPPHGAQPPQQQAANTQPPPQQQQLVTAASVPAQGTVNGELTPTAAQPQQPHPTVVAAAHQLVRVQQQQPSAASAANPSASPLHHPQQQLQQQTVYRMGLSPQKTPTGAAAAAGVSAQHPTVRTAQYLGHDPNLKLPPDLCLLGCVFLLCGYQRTTAMDELKMWCRTIIQYGGEVEQTYCPRVTHVLCFYTKNNVVQMAMRDGKRCVTAYWLNDVILQHRVTPPWQALHLPVSYSDAEKPGRNMIISLSGFEDKERQCVKYMVETIGARYTGYLTRHNTHLVCRKPDGPKYLKAREWKKPVVNGQWLNDLLLGNQNVAQMTSHQKYQQFSQDEPLRVDYTQVPHLMSAWKAPIIVTREIWSRFKENPPPRNKRKFQEIDEERAARPLTTISPNLEASSASAAVTASGPPQEGAPRVLFSAVSSAAQLAAIVRRLGGSVTLAPRHATHLVMPRLQRTVKLLTALPTCSLVLSELWVEESGRQGRFVDEQPYTLHDAVFEKRFNFSLAATLARSERGSLFKGLTVYMTPGVVPGRRVLSQIVQASGGSVEDRLRPLKALKEQQQEVSSRSYAIVTCEGDLHLLEEVIKQGLPIYSTEFILGAVLRQSIDFTVSSYVRQQTS